jgi:hypothetical protein
MGVYIENRRRDLNSTIIYRGPSEALSSIYEHLK